MTEFHKRTKILATIGPKSCTKEIIKGMYDSGAEIFRLNLSHGTLESHAEKIALVRSLNIDCGIMMDTKGPEIRTGIIKDKLLLKEGDIFTTTIIEGVYEDTKKISINYKEFIKDVDIGDNILVDSGILHAQCINKTDTDVIFKVTEGQCEMTTKRHINLINKKVSLPTITEEDWKDIDFCIEKKVDFITLSFVQTENDVRKVKEYLRSKNSEIQVIAKIESYSATVHMKDIIKESDGIIIARGDLGCEIGQVRIPSMQKKIIYYANYYAKPAILATQILLSLKTNIQPTRAEVSDIGNVIYDGIDAILLCDETAESKHPIKVVQILSKIITETQTFLDNACECGSCYECFGILPHGKLRRKGFITTSYLREGNYRKSFNVKWGNCKCPTIQDCGIFSIAPFITQGIDAIASVNFEGDLIKNISASRINIPMVCFTNKKSFLVQNKLLWNVESVFNEKITGEIKNDAPIIDEYLKKKGVKKYLLVSKYNNNPIFQCRDFLQKIIENLTTLVNKYEK